MKQTKNKRTLHTLVLVIKEEETKYPFPNNPTNRDEYDEGECRWYRSESTSQIVRNAIKHNDDDFSWSSSSS